MTLVIQTNISGYLYVCLVRNKEIVSHNQKKVAFHGSDQLLNFINTVLQRAKVSRDQITQIAVVRGPGPFTAVRTGIIVANTLAWLLQLPIIGVESESELSAAQLRALGKKKIRSHQQVVPLYGREPNITKAKNR